MSAKLSGKLRQTQRRYKHYFDQNIRTMLKSSIEQFFYVDQPLLITLPTNDNSDIYNKLLPQEYGSSRALLITEEKLEVDKHSIPNIISIDRVIGVVEAARHPRRYKCEKLLEQQIQDRRSENHDRCS